MNNNYIHISLCIDKSGSMFSSKDDVIGGVQSLIDEQKKNENGKVTLSLFTFNDDVDKEFIGKNINDNFDFKYSPHGMTAMNDGIAYCIEETGKWLSDMKEEDRPGKVLVAVFTDGMENSSTKHSLSEVKEMIQHQESKYNWTFLYLGVDISTTKAAEDLGFKYKTYGSRSKLSKNYDVINIATSAWREASLCADATMDSIEFSFASTLDEESLKNTKEYEKDNGVKLT